LVLSRPSRHSSVEVVDSERAVVAGQAALLGLALLDWSQHADSLPAQSLGRGDMVGIGDV
jgi:hypothetical protein